MVAGPTPPEPNLRVLLGSAPPPAFRDARDRAKAIAERDRLHPSLIGPHDPPVNVLGGYRFPGAPEIDLKPKTGLGPDDPKVRALINYSGRPFDSGLPTPVADAMNENVRDRLPNRRRSETFGFECSGLKYTATASWFDDGRLGEVFVGNHRSILTPMLAPRTPRFSPASLFSSVRRSMFCAKHCFAIHRVAPARQLAALSIG